MPDEKDSAMDQMKKFAEDARPLMDRISALASAGLPVAVDPDIADEMGAFDEDALSPKDALESRFDGMAESD